MSYHKWLGAGLGFAFSGSPIGAIVGFGAGKMLETKSESQSILKHATDFEVNLLLLTATLIRSEKGVTFKELQFVRDFWTNSISQENVDEKINILHHFLQKDYDTQKACEDIRNACPRETVFQIIHFLFDLAESDKPISEKERNSIFQMGCWMHINAQTFLEIEKSREPEPQTIYSFLGVKETDSIESIRTAYRKLVLKFHPDKNQHLSAEKQKELENKLRQIKEAYEIIKLKFKA